MSFDAQALTDALTSIVAESGSITVVTTHEPLSAPPAGLAAALWMQSIGPARKISGLPETAARVEYTLRLYLPLVTGALDAVDPTMANAAATLIGSISAGFTLGGEVFEADLLGGHGAPLGAKAGYVENPAGQTFRVIDITIPLIVDNVWSQSP